MILNQQDCNRETKQNLLRTLEWNTAMAMRNLFQHTLSVLQSHGFDTQSLHTILRSPRSLAKDTKAKESTRLHARFPREDYLKLSQYYESVNKYPSGDEKRQLANETLLTLSQVNSWFSNRRARSKRSGVVKKSS